MTRNRVAAQADVTDGRLSSSSSSSSVDESSTQQHKIKDGDDESLDTEMKLSDDIDQVTQTKQFSYCWTQLIKFLTSFNRPPLPKDFCSIHPHRSPQKGSFSPTDDPFGIELRNGMHAPVPLSISSRINESARNRITKLTFFAHYPEAP